MIGRKLIQPSLRDGGNPDVDVIATTIKTSNIFEAGETDVALAELAEGVTFTPRIHGLNMDFSGITRSAEPGDVIIKSGRSSGITVGMVISTKFTALVKYPCGYRIVYNNILTTPMLAPGDSGSPAFNLNGDFIGQCYAGSPLVSLITPADSIMREFNVRIVGGSKRLGTLRLLWFLLKLYVIRLLELLRRFKKKIGI